MIEVAYFLTLVKKKEPDEKYFSRSTQSVLIASTRLWFSWFGIVYQLICMPLDSLFRFLLSAKQRGKFSTEFSFHPAIHRFVSIDDKMDAKAIFMLRVGNAPSNIGPFFMRKVDFRVGRLTTRGECRPWEIERADFSTGILQTTPK